MLSAVYSLPHVSALSSPALANDWQINTIASLYDRLAFHCAQRYRSLTFRHWQRLRRYCRQPRSHASSNQVAQYFNTAAFTQAITGTFGNVGRNTLRGPDFFDVDASVVKNFHATESCASSSARKRSIWRTAPNFQNPTSTVSRRNLRSNHRRQRPACPPVRPETLLLNFRTAHEVSGFLDLEVKLQRQL